MIVSISIYQRKVFLQPCGKANTAHYKSFLECKKRRNIPQNTTGKETPPNSREKINSNYSTLIRIIQHRASVRTQLKDLEMVVGCKTLNPLQVILFSPRQYFLNLTE